ncbi:MAG: peptidylprolyl isomerase [Rickettsiales bacterium]|nr:peptidylprolyl isomerase [Rickettsiales bacterium]
MKINISKPKFFTAMPIIMFLASCQASFNGNASSQVAVAKNSAQTVIATYSDGEITKKDIKIELEKLIAKNDKFKDLTPEKLTAEQKEIFIKELILKEMSYKKAKARSLNKDKDYQEALKIFESELLKQKLFIALAKEASDEKNVKKNYDELVIKLKNKKDINISYIAVKTEKEANQIYQFLLKSPASFTTQARKKSLDKKNAKKGGNIGFVLEDALPAEIIKQIKAINKGQVAKPIQSSNKWIIIKFEDERPAKIAPYQEVKEVLAQNLAKNAIESFISKTLEEAKINILQAQQN